MGITIFYRGSLDDVSQIPTFEKMVKDWVIELGGTYQDFPPPRDGETEQEARHRRETTKGARGIIASMHPEHEPLSLLVSPYGHLTSLASVVLGSLNDGDGIPNEAETCFIKTQFGTVESHIAVIQLLSRIKEKFCTDLFVNDEAGYWDSGNREELEQKLGFLRSIMTQFSDGFKQFPLNAEAAEDPDIIIERVKRIAGKIQQDVTGEGIAIEIEVVKIEEASDFPVQSTETTLELTEPSEFEIQQERLFRNASSDQIAIQKQIQLRMAEGLSFDDALKQTLIERGLPPPVYANATNLKREDDMENDNYPIVELSELIRLVDPTMSELGNFCRRISTELPNPYNELLAHDEHMTVTVEAFHHCRVAVEVLRSWTEDNFYVREILLKRESDQAVIQYGVVRLRLDSLAEEPRIAILSETIPLGRVLIEHNVLRNVELVELWEIEMGPRLAKHFGCTQGAITFGRTAMIYFDNQPALELIEIVRPESPQASV